MVFQNHMTFGKNVRDLRKKDKLSQADLAEQSGQSLRTISRIETGKWRGSLEVVFELAKFFDIPPEELDPGLTDRLHAPDENEYTSIPYAQRPVRSLDGQSVYLPHYGLSASAGAGTMATEPDLYQTLSFRSKWIQNVLKSKPEDLFLIDVLGNSMEPTFHSGDTVLVDTKRIHLKANGFYVFRLEGNLYVKRVERLIDGRIKIQSDNTKYETIILESEKVVDLEVFGRVVWRAETMI